MNRLRLLLSLLSLAGLFLGLIPGVLGAPEAGTGQEVPAGPVVARIYYQGQEELNALGSHYDVWEVHFQEGYVVAMLFPEEYQELLAQGYRMEIDREKTSLLGINAPLDPRYYYFDNYVYNSYGRYMVDFLQQVNADYANLVELLDIGDAWQASHGGHHRDLWVLRITNEDPAYGSIADKPTFVLHANIHAREVSTPEMAIRYIKYLTSGYNGQGGYGIDPDVTWLVDWNVAYIMVSANPDGHAVNEQDTSANRRKNMDNDDGCSTPSLWGVDLNRNHRFLWACCGGSSGNPCAETYRGPSRSSEPETFYFQNFITMNNILRDQNGPNGPDTIPPAAPLTTTGLLLSLHTYSDYVLWPWGFTQSPAPNSSQLVKIGRKFSYYTGYDDRGFLYTVDGDTHDWSYGQLGVASFTFEIGPQSGSCGGFFPAYGCQDGIDGMPRNFWAENRPAFIYAHKIARTPYLTAYGPDAQNLAVSPNPVPQGQPVSLSALIQDHRCCGDTPVNIGGAEYFIDQPGQDGAGIPMTPQDGSWGGASETALATVDTSGLSVGRHYILVHGKSSSGNYWGPFTAVFLTVEPPAQCDAVQILGVHTTTAGCAVTFSAELSGTAPFAYAWDFGPFGSSSEPTPTVNFSLPGTYPYTLTVSNCYGQYSDTFSGTVTVDCCVPPENASFTYAPALPVAGEPTVFTGAAESNRPLAYAWSFGDGAKGEGNPITHTYAAGGNYTVRMTATNECGATFAQETLSVCAPASNASFTWSPVTPTVGQWVYFHGQGSGTPPLSYAWDFGDGGRGSGANVSHRYNQAGEYTVVMTLTNACGRQAVYHTLVVIPAQPPCDPVHNAAFAWVPTFPYAGEVVTFTGSAQGDPPITYIWDLGDGTHAEGMVVAHTYAASGTYTVVMTATNCGTHTAVVSHTVQVLASGGCIPAYDAAISFAPDAPYIFQPVLFTATVSGDAPFTYTWSFGDGTYGSGRTTTHTYGLPGSYTVVLTATNCGGSGLATALRVLEVGAYRIYLPLVGRSW